MARQLDVHYHPNILVDAEDHEFNERRREEIQEEIQEAIREITEDIERLWNEFQNLIEQPSTRAIRKQLNIIEDRINHFLDSRERLLSQL